jgi:hypothetical protein
VRGDHRVRHWGRLGLYVDGVGISAIGMRPKSTGER